MTSLALTTSTGATANIKAQPLPGGAVAVAHAFVDLTGAQISVALDATVQAVIASLQGLIVALPQVSLLPAYFDATANGTGFVAGDVLARVVLMDTSASPPVVASGGWVNSTQGTLLPSAPASGTIVEATRNVSAAIRFNAPRAVNSNTLQNIGDNVVLKVDGYNSFGIQLTATSAWTSGVVSFFGSMDDGATYPIPLSMASFGTAAPDTTTATAIGNFEKEAGTITHVKIAVTTAIVGGPVSALIIATNGVKRVKIAGSSAAPLPVLDGGNAPFTGSPTLTVGAAAVAAGRSLRVYADAVGKVSFKTSAGNTINRYFNPGENEFAFAVTQVLAVTAPDGTAYSGTTTIFENEA